MHSSESSSGEALADIRIDIYILEIHHISWTAWNSAIIDILMLPLNDCMWSLDGKEESSRVSDGIFIKNCGLPTRTRRRSIGRLFVIGSITRRSRSRRITLRFSLGMNCLKILVLLCSLVVGINRFRLRLLLFGIGRGLFDWSWNRIEIDIKLFTSLEEAIVSLVVVRFRGVKLNSNVL